MAKTNEAGNASPDPSSWEDVTADASEPLRTRRDIQTETPFEKPGQMIGPYRLVKMLGEGGFGEVFLAEQTEPVRREVALKIIKLGMDSRQLLARFEAERQTLARLDHPNVARVLDAGITGSGRSYFVMDLVRGEQITSYCDRRKLNVRARLELFQTERRRDPGLATRDRTGRPQ